MNNHHRAVYQPLMENVPIYDLGDDEIEEERSRLPLLIVIALLVLAAFAGVVWLAYNQGVARGRAGAGIVIAAPEGPIRTAPENAGGATAFTGLKVYGDPLPPDEEAASSNLAPGAPSGTPLEIARPASPTTEAPPVRLDPATVAPPPAPVATPAPAPRQAALSPAPAASTTPPAPARSPAPPASAPSAPTVAANAVSGGILLQIGAYESEDIANGAWAAFRSRFPEEAATLGENIQRADLGARGIWYRLRVGPFPDRPAAVAACERLKAAGGSCFIATP